MTRVAFYGSHPLGTACLEALSEHEGVDVVAVNTYPPGADTWWEGSLCERAEGLGYPVHHLDDDCALEYDVDYLLSVYYPNVVDADVLDHPDDCALNLHQAELPRYRGSNVFTHSIMNARADGYWRHGTTLHVMAPKVDAGDVIARRLVPITETDTARDLYERTCLASRALFRARLPSIADGTVADDATPQSAFSGERYYYAKDSLDGLKEIPAGRLANPDPATAVETYDRIRALDFPPFQPAYTTVGGRRVDLTSGEATPDATPAVPTVDEPRVGAGTGDE
ncbi:methionyl-tRNA formyltransferase [Candidatus Halobonum tyrrellensis]|uniref:Formyltransferase n=1 Tax=Candidatus Halobonum tyrrellensis G22 TaxID=1324957 RepID=V4GNF0_9EURY|nr:formyltransferase family protein [Candidatus Halobonum tyrrellensis]ESP86926.1 formyltransferase [Candidatus Halobonum tyrrellensis G22]